MLDTPATFMVMAGAAFLAASYGPAAWNARSAPMQELAPVAISHTGKGDRLQAPRPSTARSSVSTVEIVGVSKATVVLRDRDGTVLYRSDPLSNATVIAKDASLPIVTLKDTPQNPAAERNPLEPSPVGPSVQDEGRGPARDTVRTPRTFGCESAVSPLVRGSDRAPGRCRADAASRSAS